MGTAVGTFIPKIFEEHLDTAASLWARRRMALGSQDYTGADIAELDDLIEAHFEGLAAAGEDAVPILLEQVQGDDALHAFAAASALLRVGTPETLDAVSEAFRSAKGKKLEALRDAIAHGPSAPLKAELSELFLSAPPPLGAAAGEALAFLGGFSPSAPQIERFVRAEEPAARAAGWRIVANAKLGLSAEWYALGLRDEDEGVRQAALLAAAWNASPAFYPYCRAFAANPTPESIDALVMLAAVAPPQEYQLIEYVGANAAAGLGRLRVVASFGHPYFIDFLLRALEGEGQDPEAQLGAASAFEKMTGVAVKDVNEARKAWRDLAPSLSHASRIARGIDVSGAVDRTTFALLDRESAWQFCLRARLTTGWAGTPLTLERFPQRV
jgi:uncharacterized protein (TIGR02270 family)